MQPVTASHTSTPLLTADDTLSRLAAVIKTRSPQAGGDPEKSYVARLLSKGPDAILKKIGEEATEVVMAGKDADGPKIVAEMADLWFHCLVALQAYGLHPQDVLAELARREGLSGLEEFALRKAQAREAQARETEPSTDTRVSQPLQPR